MTYEDILTYFTVKSRHGDKAQCICPAHNDREASLTISKGEKGTVVHCHAGCETADILKAKGLTMKDLFEDDPVQNNGERWKSYVEGREKRKVEDIYKYIDLNGNYAFTRLRLSGKKFIYGIMEGDRFNYGLNGKSRKSIPAVFCKSLKSVQEAIEDGQRIFYCEGEKDVKTVNSHGLTGITCGASGDWVSDCAALFDGADVVILQDNDKPGEKSAKAIERDLRKVAKSVRIIVPTPDLEHGDISDFFRDHTVEDLNNLVCHVIPKAEKGLPDDDPGDLDRFHLVNEMGRVTGVFDLEIFRYLKETNDLFVLGGIPFIYESGVFRPDQSGAKLKTMIRDLIYPEFVKSPTIKRIYDLFISDAALQVTTEDLNQYPVEWINFRNGFYDPVGKQMIPHDSRYRATNQIPYEYDPEGHLKGSLIKPWLMSICNESEDITMLCQYAGLCMTRDTRQQKFLILNGEGGTGKSVVIRMIEKMVGTENISNISLNQLSQRFAAFGLMGKLLNSCADLEIDALSDVSTLKKVLGEDVLSAEAKGKDAVSFKSYAKLVFSTNELPIVKAEKTNGFYRRLLVLTMNKVPDHKLTHFFDLLSEETDDFIRIAVRALEKLYSDGTITESSGSIEAVKRLRCDSDTVEAFLNDQIVKSPEGRLKKLDVYRKYEAFCQEMERQSLTKQNFYRSMRTKGISEVKRDGVDCFKGILYKENLPETSLQTSLFGFQLVTEEEIPFEGGDPEVEKVSFK